MARRQGVGTDRRNHLRFDKFKDCLSAFKGGRGDAAGLKLADPYVQIDCVRWGWRRGTVDAAGEATNGRFITRGDRADSGRLSGDDGFGRWDDGGDRMAGVRAALRAGQRNPMKTSTYGPGNDSSARMGAKQLSWEAAAQWMGIRRAQHAGRDLCSAEWRGGIDRAATGPGSRVDLASVLPPRR
jgi:hypothetical protein